MARTYTTNKTRYRAWRCAVGLANESMIACRMMVASKSERALTVVAMEIRTSLRGHEGEMLDDRPQRQRGHGGQRPDQDDDADQQAHEQRRVGGQCARAGRHEL